LLQKSVGKCKKVFLKITVDNNKPQEAIAHIGIAKCVVPYAHELKRVLSSYAHPGLHQPMPAQDARQSFEQGSGGRQHVRPQNVMIEGAVAHKPCRTATV